MARGAVCYAHLPAGFHTGYFDFCLPVCFSNSFMPRLTNNSLSALAATDFTFILNCCQSAIVVSPNLLPRPTTRFDAESHLSAGDPGTDPPRTLGSSHARFHPPGGGQHSGSHTSGGEVRDGSSSRGCCSGSVQAACSNPGSCCCCWQCLRPSAGIGFSGFAFGIPYCLFALLSLRLLQVIKILLKL